MRPRALFLSHPLELNESGAKNGARFNHKAWGRGGNILGVPPLLLSRTSSLGVGRDDKGTTVSACLSRWKRTSCSLRLVPHPVVFLSGAFCLSKAVKCTCPVRKTCTSHKPRGGRTVWDVQTYSGGRAQRQRIGRDEGRGREFKAELRSNMG